MELLSILLWLTLALAAGMFAHVRRNRSGVAWFFIALLISPPLAFLFVAILQPLPAPMSSSVPITDDSRRRVTTRIGLSIWAIGALVLFTYLFTYSHWQ